MKNDRRKSQRIDFGVNVEYKLSDGSSIKFGKIFNSSLSGCHMKTTKQISSGTDIQFKFEEEETFFPATVIWCQKNPVYVGIEHEYDVGIEYKQAIRIYVNKILKKLDKNFSNLEINS